MSETDFAQSIAIALLAAFNIFLLLIVGDLNKSISAQIRINNSQISLNGNVLSFMQSISKLLRPEHKQS